MQLASYVCLLKTDFDKVSGLRNRRLYLYGDLERCLDPGKDF